MRRPAARWLLLPVAAMVLAGLHVLQQRVLEPRRLAMLGLRVELPRGLLHASAYGAARAAGEEPRFLPGEHRTDLSELPARTAALSLGGLRGFFTVYLWIQAEEEKHQRIHEDLLDKYYRIANLQPDYPSVWSFHSWNLAYNLSVQWSTAERRYEWVRRGIDFLAEGIRRNPRSVELYETMGRIYFWKIANNNNPVDREYFSQQVIKDDGADPLLVAYGWYDRARRVQDETGVAHPTFNRKMVHNQPCFAMHEYAKKMTREAMAQLRDAATAQADGRREEAQANLRAGRETLARALGLWNATTIEWLKQRERFPDDYNAGRFGEGAQMSRAILEQQMGYLAPSYLEGDPQGLLVRIKSAQAMETLTEPFQYALPPAGAFYGPFVE